jgi:hypothetical protein
MSPGRSCGPRSFFGCTAVSRYIPLAGSHDVPVGSAPLSPRFDSSAPSSLHESLFKHVSAGAVFRAENIFVMQPIRISGRTSRPGILTCWGRGSKTIWLCAALTGIFASYLVLSFVASANRDMPYRFGDFFALWSYAKTIHTHPAADLYDFATLHSAQVVLGMGPDGQAPFPYPPTFLLMLWPLGLLSFSAAYATWIGGTLVLYIASISTRGRGASILILIALVAPTTAINMIAGQSGFLSAALLIGGLRLMDRRPIASGLLFGLLTYKPQFGILVPVALVAVGQWRCIAAVCAATVAMVVVTTVAFGGAVWAAWLQALPAYLAWFETRTVAQEFRSTVTADLQSWGIHQEPARLAQAAAACFAAALVWVCFRHLPRALAVPALLAATCLATPHAFIYDLPMLTAATLLFVAYRLQSTTPFHMMEIGVLILILTFPAIMARSDNHLPISSVAISFFEILILTTGRSGVLRERQCSNSSTSGRGQTVLVATFRRGRSGRPKNRDATAL